MKLTVTLVDNGKPREAIPVRSIPLVTDWFVSAHGIAIALTGESGTFHNLPIAAYIQTDGKAEQIPLVDWHLIVEQLDALSASLPDGLPGKYEWRCRSIAELPATAFLWADEFSYAYRRAFNRAAHLEKFAGETIIANGEMRIPAVVTPQLRSIALEGFPQESQAASIPTTESGSPLLRKRSALIAELCGVWPTIKNDLNEASRNGLDKAKRGGSDWCVQDCIRWGATKGKITKHRAVSFIRADEGSEIAAFLRANFGI